MIAAILVAGLGGGSYGARISIAVGNAGNAGGAAVLRRHLPVVRRRDVAADASHIAGIGHRRPAGYAPAGAGPAAARTGAVGHIGADLRAGHDLPMGLAAAGLGPPGPARRRVADRA